MIKDNIGGQRIKDATANSEDILQGKVAYNIDGKVIGSMPDNSNGERKILTISSPSFTLAKGYHDGTQLVNINTQVKSVKATKQNQVITPDTSKVLSSVSSLPVTISDNGVGQEIYGEGYTVGNQAGYARGVSEAKKGTALPADVLAGKTFTNSSLVGTKGTMKNNGNVNSTLSLTKTSYTVPQGYHDGDGKINIVKQSLTITPNGSVQSFTPDSGKIFSPVVVNAVTKASGIGQTLYSEGYSNGDIDGYDRGLRTTMIGNAQPINVASGYTFTNSSNIEINGTMPNKSGWNGSTIKNTKLTIPQGYHDGTGKISVENSYEAGKTDGINDIKKGTALPENVLTNYTFSNANGVNISGTMIDNADIHYFPQGHKTVNEEVYIDQGYHNGQGYVVAPKYCIHPVDFSNPLESKKGTDLAESSSSIGSEVIRLINGGNYQTQNLLPGHVYAILCPCTFEYVYDGDQSYPRHFPPGPEGEKTTWTVNVKISNVYELKERMVDKGDMEEIVPCQDFLIVTLTGNKQPIFNLNYVTQNYYQSGGYYFTSYAQHPLDLEIYELHG